jgi:superfamily II DNA/RNA helicase
MTFSHFEQIGLNKDVLQAVQDLGYQTPTKVQQEVIPAVLSGRDIIVKSETGSGKTAAYAIPICNQIHIEENNPQALVMAPTRELALQVKEEITSIGRYRKIRCAAIFGKQPMNTQTRELKQRVHMISGTPGRLLDHINEGNLILSDIRFLVLDEADEMLSMGFIEQVEEIVKLVPRDRVTMLFSATIPQEVEELARQYMKDPLFVEINPGQLTVENIDQYYIEAEEKDKFELLMRLLYTENPDSCLIFCRTKERTSDLSNRLRQKGIPCRELHGGMLQEERLETIKGFKRGAFRFLAATDVAARGIDIEAVSHVVNYDIPQEKERYVHRIGRTGRAGSNGKAISFAAPFESKFLKQIEEYIHMEIPLKAMPTREEAESGKDAFLQKNASKPVLKEDKSARVNVQITKLYIGGGKKNKVRPGDIVGAISNIDGIAAEDIGIIDIRDYVSYVEIMNGKGDAVLHALQNGKIKGRQLRVEKSNK